MTETPSAVHMVLTPELSAAADMMHARGRHTFNDVFRGYREHLESCTEPDCNTRREEFAVAALAADTYEAMFACGHRECLEAHLQSVCEAVAYAAVRTAAGAPLDPQGGGHA